MSYVMWDCSLRSWGIRNAPMEFVCSSFLARSRVWPWSFLTRGCSHLPWLIQCLLANNQKDRNRAARDKHMVSPTCPIYSLNRGVDRGRVSVAKTQMGEPSHCQNQSPKSARVYKMALTVGWRPGRKEERPLPLSSRILSPSRSLPLSKHNQALYETTRPN